MALLLWHNESLIVRAVTIFNDTFSTKFFQPTNALCKTIENERERQKHIFNTWDETDTDTGSGYIRIFPTATDYSPLTTKWNSSDFERVEHKYHCPSYLELSLIYISSNRFLLLVFERLTTKRFSSLELFSPTVIIKSMNKLIRKIIFLFGLITIHSTLTENMNTYIRNSRVLSNEDHCFVFGLDKRVERLKVNSKENRKWVNSKEILGMICVCI